MIIVFGVAHIGSLGSLVGVCIGCPFEPTKSKDAVTYLV